MEGDLLQSAVIESAILTLDEPAREETGYNAVSAAGSAIYFVKSYIEVPIVICIPTVSAGNPRFAIVITVSNVKYYNSVSLVCQYLYMSLLLSIITFIQDLL